jgi:hypothetical protein
MSASGALTRKLGSIVAGFLFCSSLAHPITIYTGGEFIANANVCIPMPDFVCPPLAVMLEVRTQLPQDGTAGYSLEAWLISDVTGQMLALPDKFEYGLVYSQNWEPVCGAFPYNGRWSGFPFPAGFFGPHPQTDTFSILFKNTGKPFSFYSSPEQSVTINLDSGARRWGIKTNDVHTIPEPVSGLLSAAGLLAIVFVRIQFRKFR